MNTQELTRKNEPGNFVFRTATPRPALLRNILWATDFSGAAEKALSYARALARRHRARLYAAHVLSPHTQYFGPGMPLLRLGLAEQMALRKMSRLLDSQPPEEVPYQKVVGLGKASRVLANMVQDFDIDLIVLGTRGTTAITRTLLGSVAQQTVRLAPCPVLTVSAHASPHGDTPMQWNRIFCAVDFSLESVAAARTALVWAREYSAQLVLFHVVEAPVSEALDERGRLTKYYAGRLERIIPPRASSEVSKLELKVEFGSPAEWILRGARQCGADLIVLGTRMVSAPGGKQSARIARTILTEAHCPVLTVNDGGPPA